VNEDAPVALPVDQPAADGQDADGPSAHGPLPEPGEAVPDDLVDGLPVDDAGVVLDTDPDEPDRIVAAADGNLEPLADDADGLPPDDGAVVQDEEPDDAELDHLLADLQAVGILKPT
jgi:hypothetical protein